MTRQNTPTATKHSENQNFPAMLSRYRNQIEAALPRHIDPDRMMRIAVTCFRTVPKLSTCDPASVFACVIQAAQAGLEPGALGGEAHLIPRWSERESRYTCTLLVGWRGYLKLARQSGQITDVAARVVYAGDAFDLELGTDERLVHRPALGQDRGEPVAVYCVATFANGAKQVEVMTWAEVMTIAENHAPRDRHGNITGPWRDHPGPMAIKTVVRRAAKLWPQSAELQIALAADGRDMGRADADRILTGRAVDLTDGDLVELPAPDDSVALLEQQIADCETVEQIDFVSSRMAEIGVQGREAKRLQNLLTKRCAEIQAVESGAA